MIIYKSNSIIKSFENSKAANVLEIFCDPTQNSIR